jgi:hypothetical protein
METLNNCYINRSHEAEEKLKILTEKFAKSIEDNKIMV